MLIIASMNNGHLTVSEAAAARKSKARRPRARAKTAADNTVPEVRIAAAGSLTRTKALLLAALRVWELKQRVHE